MAENLIDQRIGNISFCSSISDDVWHGLAGPRSYESWHFDAVTDDGSEALTIAFYDNYPISPRFYEPRSQVEVKDVKTRSSQRCPAVSLVFSSQGKRVFDVVNEFSASEFNVIEHSLNYSIGDSSFRLARAEYGNGYVVSIALKTPRGRCIRAEFEWLLIESDLIAAEEGECEAVWNLVAPRADVSGKIQEISRRGDVRRTFPFRGTGYHDHIQSNDYHFRGLSSRVWGRAHFTDSTVVFDRLGGVQNPSEPGRFFIIKDGKINLNDATCEASGTSRNLYGLKIPRKLAFKSKDGMSLVVKPIEMLRSGLAEVKVLSEVSVSKGDEKPKRSIGFTEFVDPRRMSNPIYRWVADMRVGRHGRSPLF